ncbi:QacE family quaternary ammonium compound efflux SMR transporter [Phragmitibacter flavus]|uniref:Guanidinium exporter n=2 Tax=Phragmitibacter flavus TaxID=2576071 RepID=A0A5R8KCD0_9BACT|nr:QacE family quaternary ammonium compound efflux SMR transporter [Phragmitibacter flavus]
MGMISWIYLLSAAVFEAMYGIGLYYSKGFTVLWASVFAVISGIATTILLGLAMKGLPVGVSFVVWSGLAAVGTAIYGMTVLGESHGAIRISMMLLILAGVVGLKFSSAS